jgi:hypothetical protein
MFKLIITSTFKQIQEGACPVYAGTGIINNDPLTVAFVGDTGRSVAGYMTEGRTFYVSGHFKPAPHLGYDNLFIITDIKLNAEDAIGKRVNFYA